MQKAALIASISTLFILSVSLFSQQDMKMSEGIELLEQWQNWKVQFGKNYSSNDEELYRLNVFKSNKEIVEQRNSMQNSYTLGLTEFADITKEEFLQIFSIKNAQNINSQQSVNQITDVSADPESFSWKSKGLITPVLNQGKCDASYASATCGSVETLQAITQSSKPVLLSTQQIISCVGGTSEGCNGGSVANSLDLVKSTGLGLNSWFPYESQKGVIPKCQEPSSSDLKTQITNYQTLKGTSELQSTLLTNPVVSAIDGSNLALYTGGIFDNCSTNVNMDVLVTGYTPTYWQIRTSFGPQWGIQGYLELARGNTCGVANRFYLPEM